MYDTNSVAKGAPAVTCGGGYHPGTVMAAIHYYAHIQEEGHLHALSEPQRDWRTPMDVLGVGIDVVAMKRVRDALESGGDAFLDAVFTAHERESSQHDADPVSFLATAFAAKEAVFKTLDIDWSTGVRLSEIEVRHAPTGKPYVVLTGACAACMESRGATTVHISLSYEDDYAVACAVLVSE
ncbi:MAG: holo-ACP synthase [Actinomycetia bacterium]|nr:holo-ACP synthase [Actinomycetes bacterium]